MNMTVTSLQITAMIKSIFEIAVTTKHLYTTHKLNIYFNSFDCLVCTVTYIMRTQYS